MIIRITQHRFLRGLMVLAISGAWVPAVAQADEPLRYQFKDSNTPIYNVTITGELPDETQTSTGQIRYAIKSTDPANGQVTFAYTAQFHNDTRKKDPENDDGGLPAPALPPNPFSFPTMPAESAEIVIGPSGNVVRSNRTGDDAQLPFGLGLAWELLLPPLPPNGENPWKVERALWLYTKKENNNNNWPPQPPRQQQEDRTERAAHQTITYNIEKGGDGLVHIKKESDLSTDEKVGDKPLEQETARAVIVFDAASGVIQSLEQKTIIEINENNVSIRIPVTVSARRLTAEEFAKQKAEHDAADAKAKDDAAKLDARLKLEQANDRPDFPEGTSITKLIGGNGGGPYIKVSPGKKLVIGMAIRLGNWDGHITLGHVEPLYAKPEAGTFDDDTTVVLAKFGYAVGGVIVSGEKFADGIRIIFFKKTPTGVDPNVTYQSSWYGYTEGEVQTQLAGKGERVIGTFGLQGMNMNGIGLVLDAPDNQGEKPTFPSDDSNGVNPVHHAHRHELGNSDDQMPDGSKKTKMVGGNGGGPYTKVSSEKQPILGFSIKIGEWDGHKTLGSVEPLYAKPDDTDADDAKVEIAKDGYAVGGVIVSGEKFADGIRIIFMKKTDKGLDPKDQYLSPWHGYTKSTVKTQLGGTGEFVIGTYGLQGMNMNGIGLILAAKDADTPKDDATKP